MDGQHWMASAMRAARAQLEIATHNLANASTGGFRRALATTRLGDGGLAVTERRAHEQGAVRATGRRFDLALLGEGAFRVGGASTREGAFTRDRDGYLTDDRGRRLRGAHGALRVSEDAAIESDGSVRDGGRVVGRIPLPRGTRVMAGALETSTVNPIGETLAILTAQRAFETAQKTLLAIDAAREKGANDVVRLK
ncbi:MAG TPA: flagellar basal body rod C-terminal domain-containing protein [Candidatus Elarobacter sp.]|jgi:flagellar basal body rod protein FlgG|nr:flagellar basal body rod C-terminal domain-containing protein [Candidatus Elarobacter sp.]